MIGIVFSYWLYKYQVLLNNSVHVTHVSLRYIPIYCVSLKLVSLLAVLKLLFSKLVIESSSTPLSVPFQFCMTIRNLLISNMHPPVSRTLKLYTFSPTVLKTGSGLTMYSVIE